MSLDQQIAQVRPGSSSRGCISPQIFRSEFFSSLNVPIERPDTAFQAGTLSIIACSNPLLRGLPMLKLRTKPVNSFPVVKQDSLEKREKVDELDTAETERRGHQIYGELKIGRTR